jgi:hypothetical protein
MMVRDSETAMTLILRRWRRRSTSAIAGPKGGK